MKYLPLCVGLIIGGIGGAVAVYALQDVQPEVASAAVPLFPMTGQPIAETTATDKPAPATDGQARAQTQPIDDGSAFDTLSAVFQVAAQAGREELARSFKEATQSKDTLYFLHVAEILIERMVEIDPQWAAETAVAAAPQLRARYLWRALDSWSRSDEDAAYDYFRALEDPELRRYIGRRLARNPALSSAFRLALVDELGQRDDYLEFEVLQTERSPQALFQAALEGRGGRWGLESAARRWAEQSPEDALAATLALPPTRGRSRALLAVLEAIATRDIVGALDLARMHEPDEGGLEEGLLHYHAQLNPTAALPLVEEYQRRTGSSNPLQTLLAEWVKRDAPAALEYYQSLPEAQREYSGLAMMQEFADHDPEAALRWAVEHDDRSLLGNATRSLYRAPEPLVSLAESLMQSTYNPQIREELALAIAQRRFRHLPAEQAIAWIEAQGLEDVERLWGSVFGEWAQREPQAAATAIAERGYRNVDSDTLGHVAASLYRQDPKAGLRWVGDLPDRTARDAALAQIAHNAAQSDFEQSRQLLEDIASSTLRERTAIEIAQSLHRGEPGELPALMRQLGVSEATIEVYMLVWGP